MHDVVGQVVVAAGDENFGATQDVASVRHGDRLGAGQAEIGACMRFGQAHGGQPLARGQFVQVQRFELVARMVFDAFISAMQDARRHGPAVVRGRQHFIQHDFQHAGQALATVFGAGGQSGPTRLPKRLVSRLEAWRHGDHAVLPLRTDLVAIAVQRGNDLRHKFAGFVQHLLHQGRVCLGKGGQGLQLGGGV